MQVEVKAVADTFIPQQGRQNRGELSTMQSRVQDGHLVKWAIIDHAVKYN